MQRGKGKRNVEEAVERKQEEAGRASEIQWMSSE